MNVNMKILIKYRYKDNDVWALWKNEDGSRWYEHIVINGVGPW